jgi:hypothetical protein
MPDGSYSNSYFENDKKNGPMCLIIYADGSKYGGDI